MSTDEDISFAVNTVVETWQDRDADGMRQEINREWPQLGQALDELAALIEPPQEQQGFITDFYHGG